MNEIRVNKEKEKIVAKAGFAMPKLFLLTYIYVMVACVGLMIGGAVEMFSGNEEGKRLLILMTIGLIGVFAIFIIHLLIIGQTECVVTNKRIYGTMATFLIKKEFVIALIR